MPAEAFKFEVCVAEQAHFAVLVAGVKPWRWIS